jgi:maleylpyruvate isomerase
VTRGSPPGGPAAGRAAAVEENAPVPDPTDDLYRSTARLLDTAERLTDVALAAPSRLPGWTRRHLLTHVSRSADSRRRMLDAARAGAVGRQYPSEEHRAAEIEAGSERPAGEIRRDLRESLELLRSAVAGHPPDRWDEPGEWLGVGLRPVRRVVPSMVREIEYHHVDLGAEYEPDDWPAEFVDGQLSSVVESRGSRPGVPPLTVVAAGRTLRIGTGEAATVSGEPAAVLAWLTGRSDGRGLTVDPPGALPDLPPLA